MDKINNEESSFKYLDLRGTPCPLNFIRCSLAIENLEANQILKVDIDKGEPEEEIFSGLSNSGHKIQILRDNKETLTLIIHQFENT